MPLIFSTTQLAMLLNEMKSPMWSAVSRADGMGVPKPDGQVNM